MPKTENPLPEIIETPPSTFATRHRDRLAREAAGEAAPEAARRTLRAGTGTSSGNLVVSDVRA